MVQRHRSYEDRAITHENLPTWEMFQRALSGICGGSSVILQEPAEGQQRVEIGPRRGRVRCGRILLEHGFGQAQ
jgi:hypothetical protein